MSTFKTLVWKNFLLRRRRCLMQLIELLMSIFLLLPIFFIKIPKGCRLSTYPYARALEEIPQIMYAPDTPPIKMLMDDAADSLNITPFQSLSGNDEYGTTLETMDENFEIFRALENVDAVVQFENLDSIETLPDQLVYTVHLLEEPESRESLRNSILWENIFGATDKLGDSFLKLQWAIDSRFIKMKSNSTFEFPNIILRRQQIDYRNVECYSVKAFLFNAIVFLTPMMSFVLIMIRLNEERSNGVEALLEVSGVPWFIIDVTNFLDALLPCLIVTVIASVALQLKTNKIIIFMCLFFNWLSLIALSFACSNITTCGANVAAVALFIYLGTFILDIAIWPTASSSMTLILKGLLPHMPSLWIMQQIHIVEFMQRIGLNFLTWNKVLKYGTTHRGAGSVQLAVAMLFVQTLLYFVLSLFLRLIRPKKYGKELAWNFFFLKEFWIQKRDYIPPSASNHDSMYDRYFEAPPKDMDVAVEVVNVTKTYYSWVTSVVALNNVSVKMYKGEITVLVGQNGSGKTTLLSIIAGMQKQTSGKVFIDRLDTSTLKMAQNMAFCPQRSILLPLLTVREHLMLFSKITGYAGEAINKTIEHVMTLMNLSVKEALMPSQLSIGLQRRLQIGCLLCSQASLLLLDDPTAEIDVEARKDLHKILFALRADRTIIMTTNFLEEAEILGDRIAALQRGEVRCFASPQFLKKAIDSGSRVHVTSFQPADLDFATKTIRGVVPDATLNKKIMGSLVYNIPPGSNMKALFETLESNTSIETTGVGSVSIEEAFMKICTDGETNTYKERESVFKNPDEVDRIEGFRLLLKQMRELFKRQLDYTYSRLLAFIFLHLLVPAFVTMLLFIGFKVLSTRLYDWPTTVLNLKIYNEIVRPSATYRLMGYDLNKTQHTVNKMKETFPQLQFRASEAKHENCSCSVCKKVSENSTNIFDIYVDAHSAKLKYDQNVKYSASVGLNVLSNIIAIQQLPNDGNQLITMRVGTLNRHHHVHILSDELIAGLFSIFIIFISLIPVIDSVGLPCRERFSNTRYYHSMAGCPLWLYFLVTLIYQVACYALTVIPSIIAATGIFDYDSTLKHIPVLRAYFASLLICGISFYILGYFLSQCFNEETTKILLVIFMIIGELSFIYVWVSYQTYLNKTKFYKFLVKSLSINVVFRYVKLIKHLVTLASLNQVCWDHYNPKKCKEIWNETRLHSALERICCDDAEYGAWVPYFFELRSSPRPSLTMTMARISFNIIGLTILALMIEYRLLHKLWNKYELQRKVEMPCRKYDSNDVAAEKEYVNNAIMRSKETIKDLVLVSRVWKICFNLFNGEFLLKDLNYSVRKGECFAIVGLNGSGKTSVFKAMTRKILITKGVMFADGHFSHENTASYLKTLGYCPHSLYLDAFRTGSNNMRMLMCLRGINKDDVETQCDAWQKILGLDRFRNTLVEEYSYGMERRISVGTAMCRSQRVILLDQPLSGVDVAARHELFTVMKRALANGCSIIHASHNLEVVDRMCTQLTIMDDGEMGALGSPKEYKKSYASGHSVMIRLRRNSVLTPSGSARVQSLKDLMNHEFNGFLRDEYLVAVHSWIEDRKRDFTFYQKTKFGHNGLIGYKTIVLHNDRLRYSLLHEKLASLANDFREVIEEYSVHNEKFEDAFIQFVNDSRHSVKP